MTTTKIKKLNNTITVDYLWEQFLAKYIINCSLHDLEIDKRFIENKSFAQEKSKILYSCGWKKDDLIEAFTNYHIAPGWIKIALKKSND